MTTEMTTDVTHRMGTFLETSALPLPVKRPDGITPFQTVGPFFHYALTPEDYAFEAVFTNDLTTPAMRGQRITLTGCILDGENSPVPDAMVEIWQADADGRYAGPEDRASRNDGFTGFGRCATAKDGTYSFQTVRPGAVQSTGQGTDEAQINAPHINVHVFARGMLLPLHTRVYFPDEPANASDLVLGLVTDTQARATLIAKDSGGSAFRFDIRLHGAGETVFFSA
jgi:protocatechuate 3,4-dioxygenase, alpha subunit